MCDVPSASVNSSGFVPPAPSLTIFTEMRLPSTSMAVTAVNSASSVTVSSTFSV